ncbi:gp436 family protein [Achromobacter xylosoxidans]|uniref:gp436 family protein n=1 Tax=Alcaligenes xylosoxydans xylosoxydans TaxID=85698 RepID=UPI001F0DD016|nr:phage protein Gp36 family protein [Achromobacter xylosoxidans]MCH4576481.1 DUF1320 family protein [Achromobacter xylosoxidans]
MYATTADMVRQFTRREVLALTDPEDTGEIDQEILGGALVAASAEIDTYLSGRYRLPLDPIPPHLVRICCDIARYVLTGDERRETEVINNRYKAAVRFLELVASGKVTLGPAENGITPSADGGVQFVQGSRVFARQGPGAF